MPNWCSNSIQIAGKKEELTALHAAALAGAFCQHIKPCPAALTDTVSGFLGDGQAQADLEAQQARNVEVYGYATWYDFCVTEWGTKWDVGGDDCYAELTENAETGEWVLNFSFDSAWAPPTNIYAALVAQGYKIEAYYYEPGMNFCGRYTNDGGDEYYQIEGNSDWVVDNIPEEIDIAMGISEMMSEWEDTEEA